MTLSHDNIKKYLDKDNSKKLSFPKFQEALKIVPFKNIERMTFDLSSNRNKVVLNHFEFNFLISCCLTLLDLAEKK